MIRNRICFLLNVAGWLLIFIALVMAAVFGVSSDDRLYYRLQVRANVLDFAGISDEDLQALDQRLSGYLFTSMRADMSFDNREIEVYGEMQPPFNEKELIHLHDCRRLLSITANPINYCLLLAAGLALALPGRHSKARAAWTATALILLPLGIFAVWAIADFNAAFTFFHELLFTNDLWLLNWNTDLLIRICPASMFANMGLRIGLYAALGLLGVPALLTILPRISKKRKRKPNEEPEL